MSAGDVSVEVSTPHAFKCAVFDGVDDYVQTSKEFSGNTFATGFTLSVWVNVKSYGDGSATGSGAIVGNSVSNTGFLFQLRQDTSKPNFYTNSGSKLIATNAIVLDKWEHYVITALGTVGNMYLNSIQTGDINTNLVNSIASLSTIDKLVIGARSDIINSTDGAIRDVRLYNQVLTSTEISALYHGNDVTRGLIARWKLATDYNDSVGSADGTNSGSILQIKDDQVAADIAEKRVTANDKFIICDIGKQVMINHIEEAA